MEESNRNPCPFRIAEDCGAAFAMGILGSGIFQAVRGFRNAPSGLGRRLAGSCVELRSRAPLTGGSFAVWGATFSAIDCTLIYLRRKEDPWNSVISGAATGGILAARAGLASMASSALVGGVILALVEGMGIGVTRFSSAVYRPVSPVEREQIFREQQTQKGFSKVNPSPM